MEPERRKVWKSLLRFLTASVQVASYHGGEGGYRLLF